MFKLTKHGQKRAAQRGITPEKMQMAYSYGSVGYDKGATVYWVDKKAVNKAKKKGVDLEDYEGIRLVVSKEGEVITSYRNKNFKSLRKYRKRKSRGRKAPSW